MKALRFYAPEDVRLEEVDEPACGPDEVKLRAAVLAEQRSEVRLEGVAFHLPMAGASHLSEVRRLMNDVVAAGHRVELVR